MGKLAVIPAVASTMLVVEAAGELAVDIEAITSLGAAIADVELADFELLWGLVAVAKGAVQPLVAFALHVEAARRPLMLRG